MNEFLKSILDGIYTLVQNYGLSIIVFTIFIRLVLLPLDYKSRSGMRKISKLVPKQQALQKKYEKDPEKYQRKLAELYKKENASPMSGCWPMLVSMPILFAMFYALRAMANEQLAGQVFDIVLHGKPQLEPFLWIRNLWMPDSPFNAAWPSIEALNNSQMEPAQWLVALKELNLGELVDLRNILAQQGVNVEFGAVTMLDLSNLTAYTEGMDMNGLVSVTAEQIRALAALLPNADLSAVALTDGTTYVLSADSVNTTLSTIFHAYEPFFSNGDAGLLSKTVDALGKQMASLTEYQTQLATRPTWTIPLINWTVHVNFNGLFLLPLMSAGSQLLMTQLNPSTNNQPAPTKDGQPQQPAGGGFMKWFFPLFSLFLCCSYNAAFALYWVTSNLIAMATNFAINKYLDHKDAVAEANPEPV